MIFAAEFGRVGSATVDTCIFRVRLFDPAGPGLEVGLNLIKLFDSKHFHQIGERFRVRRQFGVVFNLGREPFHPVAETQLQSHPSVPCVSDFKFFSFATVFERHFGTDLFIFVRQLFDLRNTLRLVDGWHYDNNGTRVCFISDSVVVIGW